MRIPPPPPHTHTWDLLRLFRTDMRTFVVTSELIKIEVAPSLGLQWLHQGLLLPRPAVITPRLIVASACSDYTKAYCCLGLQWLHQGLLLPRPAVITPRLIVASACSDYTKAYCCFSLACLHRKDTHSVFCEVCREFSALAKDNGCIELAWLRAIQAGVCREALEICRSSRMSTSISGETKPRRSADCSCCFPDVRDAQTDGQSLQHSLLRGHRGETVLRLGGVDN